MEGWRRKEGMLVFARIPCLPICVFLIFHRNPATRGQSADCDLNNIIAINLRYLSKFGVNPSSVEEEIITDRNWVIIGGDLHRINPPTGGCIPKFDRILGFTSNMVTYSHESATIWTSLLSGIDLLLILRISDWFIEGDRAVEQS